MPMKIGQVFVAVSFALLAAVPARSAQQVTYLGSVMAVEAGRIHVSTTDPATKQEQHLWFVVDKDTKVRRGDAIVTYEAAKITNGERIAVIVDPASKMKTLAMELRLGDPAAKPAATTRQADKPKPPAPGAHAGHEQAAPGQMQMPGMAMGPTGWHGMQDGVVYALYNRQGGPRGGDEFVVPNWWMGMAMREGARHQLSLNAMLSLDPGTVGKSGYREIFQAGEALDGKPLIDRQHPHDLFMQLAGAWRLTLSDNTALTLSGGPVGEPTLGPVAFMHRASASGLVLAPLGHHTFDSTHISFGVIAASVERGRWVVEGSVFNGREPDQDRWDFDFGPLDSVAGRVWFRPTEEWEFQVSSGRLREPEELTPGDATRTTFSASWLHPREDGLKAMTFGYGVNAAHGERRSGVFGEFTLERGANSVSTRVDVQQVETTTLLTGAIPEEGHEEPQATVAAITLGGARRLATWRGFEGALGAHLTFYGVPAVLQATHGERPISFQVFLRVRLPAGGMGRMWNMRMSQTHRMNSDHSGHVTKK